MEVKHDLVRLFFFSLCLYLGKEDEAVTSLSVFPNYDLWKDGVMALPPDSSDSAPFTKHKKKKKKNRQVEEEKNKVNEIGDEERTQGDKEKKQGSNNVKKKKRGHEQMMESEETRAEERGEERERGNEKEGVTTKKKRKVNGMQPEEASQGDEAGRKKKKRKENGTQPKGITQGDEMRRKKKEKKQKKEGTHLHDMTETEPELEFSSSDIMEIEEFIPDIRQKSLDVKQKLKRYDLPRFREFKRKGLKLRWGIYSQAENVQIRRNVDDFMKLTGIQTAEELFFPQRFPDREQHLKALKAKHLFYVRIAEGLLRTCEQVYICGRKMFDSRNHKGRFSEAEVTALEKLHTIHGNNWKTIGDKLERSIYACQKRYAVLSAYRGPWTDEELQRLKDAAKKYLKRVLKSSPNPDSGPSLVQLCSKLPWKKIEQKVENRNWVQCRVKWFGYLRSRMKAVEPKLIHEAGIETRIRLIRALYELQVEDVSDVDWIELAKTVGSVTPMCVQKLFHRLKVSRIPSWTQRSFGEIVDHLFEKELPQLQQKLQCVPEREPGPVQFSLDQLFPPELDDFKELDNTA